MDFGLAYGYDKDLANGKWFVINGIRVKLAYMNSPKVEAAVKVARDDMRRSLGRPLTELEHEQVGTNVFKKHVLIDWDEDLTLHGEKFPFTPENINIVVADYPKFIMDCIQAANDNKSFQDEIISETVGK